MSDLSKPMLALLLLVAIFSQAAHADSKPDTTWKRYGENIFCLDFSKIDFSAVPLEPVALPRDIVEHAIFERHTKARNAAQLEQMIFKALPRAYPGTREGLSRLSVKDAIQLSVRVAENALSYCDVDNDTTFVRKYGADLPIEEYMGLGQGECNRYASVAYETFNFQNGAQKLEAD